MREDMFEALVVRVNLEFLSVKVVPLGLESMNNFRQLQVVRRIVPLVNLELSRSKGHNSSLLHESTSKPITRTITVDVVP